MTTAPTQSHFKPQLSRVLTSKPGFLIAMGEVSVNRGVSVIGGFGLTSTKLKRIIARKVESKLGTKRREQEDGGPESRGPH
ncbi:MAG: hypothetical protein AAFX96_11665, partial [Pseudomonadota bacterium]